VSTFQKKNIDKPDETRTFDKGHVDALTLGEVAFGRAIFEPGWKWSECVKPIAGTDSCLVHHNGYIVSGSLHIVMDDGTEMDLNEGDVFVCPPGHDAWVTSDEPCVAYDFAAGAVATYARPAS
jgi:mannose-6-phosphate isomerase-like protein (cupin superfamily)